MFRKWTDCIRDLFRKARSTRSRRLERFHLELLEDRWVPASVQFSASGETINETAGTFSIPVTLTGSVSPQLTVSTFAAGFSQPEGIAFDSSGNLYVANEINATVSKVTPAGTASGFAAIGFPEGIAFNSSGDLFIASTGTNSIIEVTPSGTVSTFLNDLNPQGPVWLACDSLGDLYFTNSAMSGEEVEVSKATPQGVVSTFVNNGNYADGLAFDSLGNLYLSVFDNSGSSDDVVDKVTPAGVLTPFATGFTNPEGLAFDSSGNLYVANSYPTNDTVSKVTPAGVVSTYASGFNEPTGLAFEGGNLYVGNALGDTVSMVSNGVSVPFTLGGTATAGVDYTSLTPSPLVIPAGQTSATITGNLLSDPGANQSLTFTLGTPSGGVTLGIPSVNTLTIDEPTSAVQFNTASETVNATAGSFSIPVNLTASPQPTVTTFASGFDNPWGMVADSEGNLYVANRGNSTISKITPSGTVIPFASVSVPEGIAINAAGDLFVASTGNNSIDEITPGGTVITFLTSLNAQGPVWVACDAEGNVYFTNSAMSGEEVEITKATPEGVVTAFVNNGNYANGLAFDASGNLYFSNFENMGSDDDSVDKVTPAGLVTPFASIATGFSDPAGLAFDSAGNLYVANSYPTDDTVSKVTPSGVISTYASGFDEPEGLVFADGNLYVDNYISATVSELDGSVIAPFSLGGSAVEGTDYSNLTPSPLVFSTNQSLATISGTLHVDPGQNQTLTFTLGTPTGTPLGSPSVNTLTIAEPFAVGVTSGSGQSATVDKAFANQLVATVTDASGDPIPGITVTFAGPASGAGVTFPDGNTAVTNAEGQVAVTVDANTTAGAYDVTASVTGIATPASFSLTNEPGAPNRLQFSEQPDNTTAGAAIDPPEVEILDQYGNLLTNDNSDQVTLSIVSGPGSFTPGSTTTETVSGGIATFNNLVLDTSGSYSLKESIIGGVSGSNSTTFTVDPSTPNSLTFSVQPENTAAGVAIGPSVKVAIIDLYGNVITSDNTDQVTLSVATGPGNFTSGSTTTETVSGGIAAFNNLVLDTAGAYMLSESATSGLSGSDSASFTITPSAPDHLDFLQQPGDTTAGSAIGPMEVEVLDKFGNLLTNDNSTQITLSVASGPGGFTAGSTMTEIVSGGVATFNNLVLDAAGSYTLSESGSGGLSGSASTSFTISPAAADHLAFLVDPSDTTAGSAISPDVRAEILDKYGNVESSDNIDQVSLSVASGQGSFAPGSTTTETVSGGIASFDNLVLDTSGIYALSENGTGGLSGNNSSSFTVGASTPSNIAFSAQPSNATAGADISPAVKVQVLDRFGNLAASDNSDQVTLSIASGPGTFTSGKSVTVTATGGIATFNNLVFDTAGSYTLAESGSNGLSGNNSASITVSPASANHLTLITQPQDTIAGNAINPAVQVGIYDQFNNLLSNDNSDQIAMTVTSGPGGFDRNSSTSATVSGGIATFSNLILDKAGTDYALTATGDGLQSDSSAFSVTPGQATQLAIISQPATNILNGDSFDVQVAAEDALGNINTGFTGNITTQLANDPNGNTNLGGTLTVAAVDGVADFNNLTLNEVGEGFTLEANSSGFQPVVTNSFNVQDDLAVTIQPQSSIMSSSSFDVQVAAEGVNGNIDTNFTGPITLRLANDPNGNSSLGGTLTLNATSGLAGFDNLTIGDAGQGFVLEATSSGQVSTETNSFNIFDQLVVTTQPSSVQAGNAFYVRVSAEDANGNVDTDFTGNVSIQLANDPAGDSTLGGTLKMAAAAGVADFNTLSLNKVGQGFTLQASSQGQLATTTNAFEVVPGASSLANSFAIVNPGNIQLDGTTSVTLQAVDAAGNDLTTGGLSVAFSDVFFSRSLGNISGGTFGPVIDNHNGTYTASFTGTIDGTSTITASINGQNVTSFSPTITVSGPVYSLSRSVVTVSPVSVQSGGTTTIELQVKSAQGVPEEFGGLAVAFKLGSVKGGQGTIGPVTDHGNGIYTATFTGRLSGLNTIEATIDDKSVTSTPPTIRVTAGTYNLLNSTVSLSASTVRSGSAIVVTLQARDAEGNKETTGGLTVTFALQNASGGTGTVGKVRDNQNGTYTATFTGAIAGNNAIVATIDTHTVTSTEPTVTVTPGPVNLAESFVSTHLNSIQSGSTTTITLQARDKAGNDLTKGGLIVSFLLGKAGGGRGTFGPVTDNHNGTYTVTFKGIIAGVNTLVATIDGLRVTSSAPSITVTPGPVSLTRSLVSVTSHIVGVNETTEVTLQARDAAGNDETTGGLNVIFLLVNPGGGQGTFGTVTDNQNGTYTITFTGTVKGINAITAMIDGAKVSSKPATITIT